MTPPDLRLVLDGRELTLRAGELAEARAGELYRDAPDDLLRQVAADIDSGQPWRQAVAARLGAYPWLRRVVMDPARARWLEAQPPPAGGLVLDVGAGWGQWAVPAAKTARVVALEPNPARLAVLRAIARQEGCAGRMYFIGAAAEQVELPAAAFDRIYCIGVLEWVPRFSADPDPLAAQRAFLGRLRGLLAPDGECVIGIENRLGLKYLLGARDDHTGLSGISCLDAAAAARAHLARTGGPLRVFTHSRAEYEELLRAAGFAPPEFFAAFPDYKVPAVIAPLAGGAVDRLCCDGAPAPEHHGNDGAPLAFAGELASHYRSLAALGIAGQFAPSYFIRARR